MNALQDCTSLFLLSVKRHTWRAGTRLRPLRLKANVLCYVADGSGTITVDGEQMEIKSGTSLLLAPNMKIEAVLSEKEPMQFYVLQYVSAGLQLANRVVIQMKKEPGVSGSPHDLLAFPVTLPATLLTMLEELCGLTSGDDYATFLQRQVVFYGLLSFVHTEQTRYAEKGMGSIQATIAYMQQNYREPLDMGCLPRLAGMTPSSYCRAFKRVTGKTPGEYLTHLRLKEAKELLTSSAYSVKDVARSVGFADELYFSRLFKKREGLPPLIYMKQAGQRVAVVSKLFLQDHLLALGIQPIAAPSFPNYYTTKSGFPQHLHHRLRGTKALNVEQRIDPQDIMSLSPDIIVRMNEQGSQEAEEWKKSARTVLFEEYLHWSEYQIKIATMFHKENAAADVIQHIENVEMAAKEALRPVTRKGEWTIIRVFGEELRLYGAGGHALTDLFYHKLGFLPDPRLTHSSYKKAGLSELMELDPERILLVWSEKRHVAALVQDPLWKSLRAVRENQVYYPDTRDWDPWGPLGREYLIQKSTSFFLQAAPG